MVVVPAQTKPNQAQLAEHRQRLKLQAIMLMGGGRGVVEKQGERRRRLVLPPGLGGADNSTEMSRGKQNARLTFGVVDKVVGWGELGGWRHETRMWPVLTRCWFAHQADMTSCLQCCASFLPLRVDDWLLMPAPYPMHHVTAALALKPGPMSTGYCSPHRTCTAAPPFNFYRSAH